MRVIEQSYAIETNCQDAFIYETSKKCVKGYKFIKKCYINVSFVFRKVLEDQSIIFFDMNNTHSQYVYRNKYDSSSCNVSRANMIQYKHNMCLNKNSM